MFEILFCFWTFPPFFYIILKPPMNGNLESIYVAKVNSMEEQPQPKWHETDQATSGYLKSHSFFNCLDIYLKLTEAYYVQIQYPYSSKWELKGWWENFIK